MVAPSVDPTGASVAVATGPHAIDGATVKVVSAGSGTSGTWQFTHGGPLTLTVPASAYAVVYRSEITVAVAFCCFSTTPDHSLNDHDLAIMRVFADLAAAQIDHRAANERRTATTMARVRAAVGGEGLSMVFQPIVATANHRPVASRRWPGSTGLGERRMAAFLHRHR